MNTPGASVNFFRIDNVPLEMEEGIQRGIAEILEENDDKLVAVESWSTGDVLFTFLPEYKVKNLQTLFSSYGVLSEFRDVTDDILLCHEKGEEFQAIFANKDYSELLTSFLRRNLTVNLILEKISEQGVSSITGLDREILER